MIFIIYKDNIRNKCNYFEHFENSSGGGEGNLVGNSPGEGENFGLCSSLRITPFLIGIETKLVAKKAKAKTKNNSKKNFIFKNFGEIFL